MCRVDDLVLVQKKSGHLGGADTRQEPPEHAFLSWSLESSEFQRASCLQCTTPDCPLGQPSCLLCGLNENGPHRLINWTVGFAVTGTVWKGLEGMAGCVR